MELKFRAWTEDWRQMIYFDLFSINDGCVTTYEAAVLLEKVPIMQFTGVRDKNGKDVYEGDILLIDEIITGAEGLGAGFVFDNLRVPVVWSSEMAIWTFDTENDERYSDYYDKDDPYSQRNFRNHVRSLMFDGKSAEVSGNIYEEKVHS